MSARYMTKILHELIETWDVSLLPEGLRIVEIGAVNPASGCHIVTFDDDGAPEDLNGKMVTPVFRSDLDPETGVYKVTITGRQVQL